MNKIFGMVSGMFTLIIFILVVVGILSLPVVIFIVITYCIVKNLLSKYDHVVINPLIGPKKKGDIRFEALEKIYQFLLKIRVIKSIYIKF